VGTEGLCDLGTANGRFVTVGAGDASSTAALTLDAEGRMKQADCVSELLCRYYSFDIFGSAGGDNLLDDRVAAIAP
jgi:hypothetical protein